MVCNPKTKARAGDYAQFFNERHVVKLEGVQRRSEHMAEWKLYL